MKRPPGGIRGRLFIASVLVVTGLTLWARLLTSPTRPLPRPNGRFVIHPVDPGDLRYVAVGDSYTCGIGVPPDQTWPTLLAQGLRKKGIMISLAANLAVDGWTTADAIHNALPPFKTASPTFATLMVGVNDTYRATTPDQFRAQFTVLMDQMRSALPSPANLVVLTIPDFTVTPIGSQYGEKNDAKRKILLFNAIIREEAGKRHLQIVDVYLLSQGMGKDRTLMAPDGLHPSAKEYHLWEMRMIGSISPLLRHEKQGPFRTHP